MSDWINLTALWQILVVGLIAGAGLPAVFAVGIRVLSPPQPLSGPVGSVGSVDGGGRTDAAVAVRSVPRIAAATVCFAVVGAAIIWALYLIVHHS